MDVHVAGAVCSSGICIDANGNVTKYKMENFVYDCRNRLVQAGDTAYQYDAENYRIGITRNVGTADEAQISYVVDSGSGELSQVLKSVEMDKSGSSKAIYYFYGANHLTAQEEYKATQEVDETSNVVNVSAVEDTYLLYHFNNVGSTTAITDQNGNVKHQYQYSPYGELLEGTYGQIAFLYNGQYGVASDDNGLYYMRARYYNIDIKRFINQDVVTGSIEQSSSLNRYAYVEGNPVNYIDPFGLEKQDKDKILENLNTLQLVFQLTSFAFTIAGIPQVAKAFEVLADMTACTIIACYMVDYQYATSQKEKDIAIQNISAVIITTLFSKILGFLGQSPGLDGALNETISQRAMELTTAGVDCFMSILSAYLQE